mgnify:CR=1 FL=1
MVGGTYPHDPIGEKARIRAMQNIFELVEQYKRTFRCLQDTDLSRLRFLYAENVVFRDRYREIRGLVALEDYFASMGVDLSEVRFEFTDQLIGERSAYLKWRLHYRTGAASADLVSLSGVSHLQFGERIEFQENYYDLAEHDTRALPWLNSLSRWFGRKPSRKTSAMHP